MEKKKTICLIGLGGCGTKITYKYIESTSPNDVHIVLADTDRSSLQTYPNVEKIILGKSWDDISHGCGGDQAKGKKATSISISEITEIIHGSDLIICIIGLGKGTAGGASPALAGIIKNEKIPSIFFATLPFAFEGNTARIKANSALKELRSLADAVVVIPNDILFTFFSPDIAIEEAFTRADSIISNALLGFIELLKSSPNKILNVDFVSVVNLLRNKNATCSIGMASGKYNEMDKLLSNFFNSPLFGGEETIKKTDAIILNLQVPKGFSIRNLNECLEKIEVQFKSIKNTITGSSVDSNMPLDFITLTGLSITYKAEKGARVQSKQASVNKRSKRSTKQNKVSGKLYQEELPLIEQNSGEFTSVPPTIGQHGENLDIPTFQRLGLNIDIGL